ncbi:hypothetical protein AR679_gp007 [Yellowstone lake phycodnavirus 1]|uniref:hypothetical protein n=1 Tax=Yellowstone lake phycodnavirus 1 TaxID=1586713 RepID=UPI0006EB66B9|nr:hypothetical protein AR679_gp007 [Yellowstone lake phycodnavirus 1]BAT22033.1 hypothetical protein [Yellowstone lake phycodnavirus 1]
MPAQSITLGTTNVPLAGLGQYVGQTGSYPLNNTRQGQQKMWMRVDANPATQGQVRNMSSFQGKQLMCLQGTTQSPVGNEIIFAMPKNSSLNCQNANCQGGGGAGAGMGGPALFGEGGAAGLVLQTQPGPGAAYILFNGTCSFTGGGGGGGLGGQSILNSGTGYGGGAGGMGIYYNFPGPIIYQGTYTANGGGGGGGGGGSQQTGAPQYGGGGGGGAGFGGGAYPGAAPFGGQQGNSLVGGGGGQSSRANGVGNGGAGGGFGQVGQAGQGGQYQTSPLVAAPGGAGGSAGIGLFINGFGTFAPG